MIADNKYIAGRLRIAFAHIPGEGWSAGVYYLKNLFYGLRSLPEHIKPEIFLLVPPETDKKSYNELVPLISGVLHRPTGQKIHFSSALRWLIGKFGSEDRREAVLSSFLRDNNVDALFAIGVPPENFLLPFLSWIPDFQHLHYPEFFSEKEVQQRNQDYLLSARFAAKIVLSSKCALEDFCRFAPLAKDKGVVLPFVAQIPSEVFAGNPVFICEKYRIPEKFILVPNQFWKHKNHEGVIVALEKALREDPAITIVCTGNTNESRDPQYFSKLLCSISQAGVRENMIILGLVPHLDMFLLMRQSMAVLQPSLFEGWNTTVEEVKSMGKKLIVSDIPVHREQDAPDAVYFDPKDVTALVVILLDIYASGIPGPHYRMEEKATKLLQNKTRQYGLIFLDIVNRKNGECVL